MRSSAGTNDRGVPDEDMRGNSDMDLDVLFAHIGVDLDDVNH
jgi:hypothetical protein